MPWLMLLPIPAAAWWLLGFPPGWGWIVQPMVPQTPVNLGELVVLGTVVLAIFGFLAWYRENL
jgi:hypothetical protein